jgi:hypothetical protein
MHSVCMQPIGQRVVATWQRPAASQVRVVRVTSTQVVSPQGVPGGLLLASTQRRVPVEQSYVPFLQGLAGSGLQLPPAWQAEQVPLLQTPPMQLVPLAVLPQLPAALQLWQTGQPAWPFVQQVAVVTQLDPHSLRPDGQSAPQGWLSPMHLSPHLRKPVLQRKSQLLPLQVAAPLAGEGHGWQLLPQEFTWSSGTQLPLQS